MHLIKGENYFWAFNKIEATNQVQNLKTKRLGVLDFEAFQIKKFNKQHFPHIGMNDIPFIVGISFVMFDEKTNKFVQQNEVTYEFKDVGNTEEQLLSELKKMAVFISNFIIEHKIEKLIFLADFLEKTALHFFDATFHDLPTKVLIDYYDIYKYFMNKRNFSILSYEHNEGNFLKSIMESYNDEYDNQNIGKDASLFFNKRMKGKSCEQLDFDKVRVHNINDLKKGVYLLNQLIKFSEISDDEAINKEFIQFEITNN